MHENKYWLKVAKEREMTFNKKSALSHPATWSLKKRCGRWKALADFERRQKESFLNNLTASDSLKIFLSLYQFGQKISDKRYYRKLDLEKVKNLSRVHSMFMRLKQ